MAKRRKVLQSDKFFIQENIDSAGAFKDTLRRLLVDISLAIVDEFEFPIGIELHQKHDGRWIWIQATMEGRAMVRRRNWGWVVKKE